MKHVCDWRTCLVSRQTGGTNCKRRSQDGFNHISDLYWFSYMYRLMFVPLDINNENKLQVLSSVPQLAHNWT